MRTGAETQKEIGGDLTSHTPAHDLLLPLLPSGPGGVDRSSLRGDRLDHHCSLLMPINHPYYRSGQRKRRALSSLCLVNARRNFCRGTIYCALMLSPVICISNETQ